MPCGAWAERGLCRSELCRAGLVPCGAVVPSGACAVRGLGRAGPVPCAVRGLYFDSISTVFVASSDARSPCGCSAKVVTETVEHGEIKLVHIGEADMVADSFTKYIKHDALRAQPPRRPARLPRARLGQGHQESGQGQEGLMDARLFNRAEDSDARAGAAAIRKP